jgi:Uma2 family endonuclease
MAAIPAPELAHEAARTYTLEDMYHLPRDGRKYELIKGELVVSPAGMQHEGIAAELVILLGIFLKAQKLGRVYTSSVGYTLPSGDLLSPDVSFVRTENLPDGKSPVGFGQLAPDLAVEIISPSDNMNDVEEKVELYLQNGTQLVWVINPKIGRATVYRADGSVSLVRADGNLSGEAVLPGFVCPLVAIL